MPSNTCRTVTFLIFRIAVVAMGIVLIVYASKAKSGGSVNMNPVVQVIQDWQTLPIVDINVKTEACTPDTEVDLFKYTWPGSVEGSNCSGTLSTKLAYTGTRSSKKRRGCKIVESIEPQSTVAFDGKYLCGVRGGISFEKVKRVDASGACPAGTEACPGEATKTPANTLCYPTAKLGECPITDFKFI